MVKYLSWRNKFPYGNLVDLFDYVFVGSSNSPSYHTHVYWPTRDKAIYRPGGNANLLPEHGLRRTGILRSFYSSSSMTKSIFNLHFSSTGLARKSAKP